MKKILLGLIVILSAGCSTVTVPELQFETGETLGVSHFRGSLDIESSRIVPFLSDPASAAVQTVGIFQGGQIAVRGEAGLVQGFDIGINSFITSSGGGWKAQGKYQWWGNGLWASSAIVGYGISSGSGGVTYLGAPIEDQQYLTIKTLSFAVPFSRRVSPTLVLYGGPFVNDAAVNGLDNSLQVSVSNMDIGANLGTQVRVGLFEAKLEVALIKISDPFSGGSRLIPYGGLSLGVWF